MKFQVGKGWARLRSSALESQDFFIKVSQESQHTVSIDDGAPKPIDDDVRDWLLNDVEMVRPFPPGYQPRFKSVKITITAEGEYGSRHRWTRTNWEALEVLLKKLPGLLDPFVTDPLRRSWLREFVVRAKEMRNRKIFK